MPIRVDADDPLRAFHAACHKGRQQFQASGNTAEEYKAPSSSSTSEAPCILHPTERDGGVLIEV